ncbi:MAG TPA: asparagine synthase-related protein [Sphingomicrobium sp.]|nr:asparagine synthase-related protein [Sphingomicrobium sp.]
MIALVWPWGDSTRHSQAPDPKRLAASLCAGIGGRCVDGLLGRIAFAYRPLRGSPASRPWRPALLDDGRIVLFHGYFDNADAIAAELGIPPIEPASLYGHAVAAWGDGADAKIVGEYCAVVIDQERRTGRCSRSPLRAPPLYYHGSEKQLIIGSVPRIFFAAGLDQRLNEARVADSAMINFSDQEASWFEHIQRVPIGAIVELERGRPRRLNCYYDPLAIRAVPVASDAQCITRVGELLDEAVRACVSGFAKPAATLSGGLDSPQVAVRTVAALPPDHVLPTFTFQPEPAYDGRVQAGMIGDERPLVEKFAAMHPRLDPHFTANEGYEHDHRWDDFFHLMGGAPSGLSNLYVFHGLFAGAAREGCDVLLVSDWGNNAFSDKGYWGFVEYFLTGRWRQLWRALRNFPVQDRSMLWRFVAQCIMPLLPARLWRGTRGLLFGRSGSMLELMQPLRREYREASGANRRLRKAGLVFERYEPWNARHARQLLFQNDDGEAAEIYQAFEQMYGVAQRDPFAYRPLVEYCWGLPTKMFMRDGSTRWLAKELAKGIMPEAQRQNRLNGRWDADWHLRIGRRRADYLATLEQIERDERLGQMIDVPRLRKVLEDWPDSTDVQIRAYSTREFAVPRALLTARFIKYVEGRNTA